MKLPTCPLFPLQQKMEKEGGREKTLQTKLFIYLPVSSFKNHGKGTMSNQVFSAVLKIPHSLHCDDVMVQLMLGTGGQPYTLLSFLETKPGANCPLSPGDVASCTAGLFHDRLL